MVKLVNNKVLLCFTAICCGKSGKNGFVNYGLSLTIVSQLLNSSSR